MTQSLLHALWRTDGQAPIRQQPAPFPARTVAGSILRHLTIPTANLISEEGGNIGAASSPNVDLQHTGGTGRRPLGSSSRIQPNLFIHVEQT